MSLEVALTLLTYALMSLVGGLILVVIGVGVASLQLRRHFRGFLLRWEKPSFGLWTIGLFLFLLASLSGGMLAYAFALKFSPTAAAAQRWWQIALLCFSNGLLVVLLYLALRLQYMYVLSERGIYNPRYRWQTLRWDVELIPWESVYDYYKVEEASLVRYTLLLRDKRSYTLYVPGHVQDTIDRVLAHYIDKYNFLYRYGRKIESRPSDS
ncbi:MAG: hypothetical protein ABDH91_03310 [Bacteroidia bacterium]